MKKPPVSLCYPTYVIEYAVIDDEVEYMNRGNLNVGGKWLGAVPLLAICKDIYSKKYFLAHCSKKWQLECMVEDHMTIEESKANAEKHYKGVGSKWKKTKFKKKEAKHIFEKAKQEMKCSFCGKSHFDHEFTSLFEGKKAKICNKCVLSFSKELSSDEGS